MPSNRPLAAAIALSFLTAIPAAWADESRLSFESDIQPVFAEKCGKCHSEKVQKGALDLSTMNALRRGGESGEPSVAETVDDSLLWIMVDDGDMPPEGQPSLTVEELDLIRRWIAGGSRSTMPAQPEQYALNQHDVLPILLLRCAACHGARIQQGDVDLRSVASMRRGGKNGPALVPGDPEASSMIRRIESEACPPRDLLLKFFVRRPSTSELNVLREWIETGAPEVDVKPDVATEQPDPLVTDEDRKHWAFQPPRITRDNITVDNHSVDTTIDDTAIDDFIAEKLATQQLTLSPEADRDLLIRRVHLDLIGMPPSPEEWKRWRDSEEADWYSQMVDHLLASPHYGERWGRYWLDLAGYADSEGGVSADPVRQVAWKYRDYVVNAFNEDKPYDRFLIEQIAGDELIDNEKAAVVTQEMVDNLTATGFLRMGIDQTGSRTMNFVPERLGVISDAVTVLGSGIMGLTMECARCHSHKYDPIPHRDYYRFKAIFQGAFDEHDWLSFKTRTLKVATPEHRQRVADVNPPLAAKLKKLESSLRKAIAVERSELLRQHYPDQSEADRTETLRALGIADNNRTLTQRLLVEKLLTADLISEDQQPPSVVEARLAVKGLQDQIERLRGEMEPALAIRALWDRGDPSPTYVLRRGEHDKPGPLVGPGVPSVLTNGRTPFNPQPPFPEGTPKTGRRLAFAKWLTSPDHPTTSRVMVNRIWYHHFGTGLVKSLENFGMQGELPSHPELLDWLAVTFRQRGYRIKEMHRLIMNSRTYRQTSRVTEDRQQRDPENRLLSRMSLRRMDAEALRDSLLLVSGSLDSTLGGRPNPVDVTRDGLVSAKPTRDGRWRRSIYLQYRRTEIPSMMETFDYPEMGPNCLTRSVSTVSPQSLMLMNNAHVRELAAAFAARVESDLDTGSRYLTTEDLEDRVSRVYALALSREPTSEERSVGVETLKSLHSQWKDPHAALATYCHAVLNSASFLYID